MQILSLTNCALDPNTGSGQTVLMWSKGLRSLGHSVEVLEPEHYEMLYGKVKARKFRQALGAWQKLETTFAKSGKEQLDLIEFYGDEFWLAAWKNAGLHERPLLVAHTNGLELLAREQERKYAVQPKSVQGALYEVFSGCTHERFSPLAFRHTDAFVSLCELDRKYVVERGFYPAEHTAVVEPGLDEEFLTVSLPEAMGREHRVAFTGAWTSRKGVGVFSSVMTRVLEQDGQVMLDVYGTGGARDLVHSRFPPALHSRIIVHPRLSNQEIANRLAKTKVFFLPSRYEGFGIAVAEAMACGCACVTTPTGFAACLRDKEEIMLCGFDDLKAMENSIFQLLRQDNLAEALGDSARQRTRCLNWSSSVKRLESIYTQWVQDFKKNKQTWLTAT